jgi:hypothetical protein
VPVLRRPVEPAPQLGHRPLGPRCGRDQCRLFWLHCSVTLGSIGAIDLLHKRRTRFQPGRSGLKPAVSRIAAILPNDLAPTNMNGPLPTFTKIDLTAARHTKSGHSCTLQHFRPRRSASRTKLAFIWRCSKHAHSIIFSRSQPLTVQIVCQPRWPSLA